jgi:hypothetical protein
MHADVVRARSADERLPDFAITTRSQAALKLGWAFVLWQMSLRRTGRPAWEYALPSLFKHGAPSRNAREPSMNCTSKPEALASSRACNAACSAEADGFVGSETYNIK